MEKSFNLDVIKVAQEKGEQDEREAAACAQRVKEAIVFLKAARSISRAAKAHIRQQLAEAQQCLTENRLHNNETVRREAWMTLISFTVGSQISSYDEAEGLVSQLVADGLLVEDTAGPLTTLGKGYRVPAEAMFEKEDIAAIAATLEEFRTRARDAFISKANPRPKDIFVQDGDFKISIPPEKHVIDVNTVRWFAGGQLLLRVAGGVIVPIDAVGGIAGGVSLARRLGVKLETKSLGGNEPPTIAFDAGDKARAEINAKTQVVWHLIKRGIRFDLWLKRSQAQANLTAQQFFMEMKPGRYFFDFGPWQEGKLKIARLVFLIERLSSQDSQGVIRIASMPGHLEDLLPKLMESYPEGEKFAGLPQPLQKMLRAMHSRVVSTASKEERITDLVNEVVESLT